MFARLGIRLVASLLGIAVAGLLALASTIVSLIIVNAIVSGLTIHGASTYIFATLIIWVSTAIAVVAGGRAIRERRRG